jgi:DNA (cytosine-5)-methyltransferase 1
MKAIDLFAGAGGFSLAAHQSGIDVIAAIEYDKQAAATYKLNFVERLGIETKLLNEDINNVDIKGLMKRINLEPMELDLLLGGPPCQGFSSHRINDSGVGDPRNNLLLRYFDFIHALKPKCFLVENVTGLLWERHKDYLDMFIELAEGEGYKIKFCNKINAKNYGVPQNRSRVFILGVRKDFEAIDLNFPPSATHFAPSSGRQAWKAASTVFEKPNADILNKYIEIYSKKMESTDAANLVDSLEFGSPISVDDSCNVHMQHGSDLVMRFMDTPLNGSRMDIPFRLDCHTDYPGHKDVYGRVILDLPSNTITTGCNNPSKGRFVHPWLHHGITLRHAARLQTFPDCFEFLGSMTEKARQIGNAVPPEFAKVLLSEIKEKISNR